MRLMYIFISLLFVQLTVQNLFAAELGEISLGGNGCFGQTRIIQSDKDNFILPLRVRLNKKSDIAFDRKTCNLRVPVKLEANEKLQILNTSQVVRILAAKGATVKSSLNISLVGKKTSDLSLNVNAIADDISIIEVLKSENSLVLAESNCGQDAMLTGNLNILATGESKAFASTGSVQLTLKIVRCEN